LWDAAKIRKVTSSPLSSLVIYSFIHSRKTSKIAKPYWWENTRGQDTESTKLGLLFILGAITMI